MKGFATPGFHFTRQSGLEWDGWDRYLNCLRPERSAVRIDLAETRRLDQPSLGRRSGAARLLILAEEAPLLCGPRLAAARAARESGYDVHIAAPLDPAFSRHAQLRAAIDAAGLAFWEMPAPEPRAGVLKELRLIGLFGDLIDALKPDLIHCIGLRPVIYAGAAARLRGLPTVLAIPGFGTAQSADGAKAALRRFMLRSFLAIAAGNPKASVVVQSAEDRTKALSARALQPRRAFLIRGAASDLALFHPRAASERRRGPPIVMFASTRLGSADVHSFAAAAALLHAKGLAGRFVIMGEPDGREPGSVSPEELGAYQEAGLIEWWGQPADRPHTFRQADIFCFPGICPEGIPGSLIEALASGLPVVAGECAGTRQAVCHGSNGLLVPPRDAQALAGALERAMGDAEFRQSAGERSREIAEAEFSLEAFLTASLIVYRAALGDRPALRAAVHPIERGRAP